MRYAGLTAPGSMADYKGTAIRQIRDRVGRGRVLPGPQRRCGQFCVRAALLAEGDGSQLTCVFVDHGLMRLNEGDEIEAACKTVHELCPCQCGAPVPVKLSGQSDPEMQAQDHRRIYRVL